MLAPRAPAPMSVGAPISETPVRDKRDIGQCYRLTLPRPADNAGMSYVVQIWAFPMPQSIDQVDGILSELDKRPKRPTTQFVELARRLTARHPCITTLDDNDDGDSPNAVWTDGPLNGHSDEAYWGLGIRTQHIDEVQPFVVETATSMGFVVFDDQQGECYLPGGLTLTPEGRGIGRHLGMPVPEQIDEAAIRRTLMDALQSAAAPGGFKLEPMTGTLVREHEEWTHTLSCRVQPPAAGATGAAAQDWLCDIELSIGHNKLARIWNELDRAVVSAGGGPAQRYRASARTTLSRLAYWGRRRWPVLAARRGDNTFVLRNAAELRLCAVAFRQLVAVEVFDMLNVVRSVEQLAFWCLSGDTRAWKPFPLLQSTPQGLHKVTLQRYLFDTEGCGGPVSMLLLGAIGAHPDMAQVLKKATAWAGQEGAGANTLKRLEMCTKALREGGLMPS
jgi:hypothetical protein